MSCVRLVVGLGNPGRRYAKTRHNAGFWYIDRLAQRGGVEFRALPRFHGEICHARSREHTVYMLKPTTYMNRVGMSVSACVKYYRFMAGEVLVVHDELDLDVGTVRCKRGGGPGGHNGLRDIIAVLGREFLRLRIGIGRPPAPITPIDYVLGVPSVGEREALEEAIDHALANSDALLDGEIDHVMNIINRRH